MIGTTAGQFCRFIVVGLISTAVSYSFFYFLYVFCGTHYQLAAAAGFMLGVFIGYPVNRTWTFAAEAASAAGNPYLMKYVSVYMISLGMGLLLLDLLVRQCGLWPPVANIFVIGFTTCTNFIGVKIWTFRK